MITYPFLSSKLFNDSTFAKTREDLSRNRKQDFKGLAIIDFESWRANYITNFGSLAVYQRESVKLVEQQHPDWPIARVKQEAAKEWEEGARFVHTVVLIGWGPYPCPCFRVLFLFHVYECVIVFWWDPFYHFYDNIGHSWNASNTVFQKNRFSKHDSMITESCSQCLAPSLARVVFFCHLREWRRGDWKLRVCTNCVCLLKLTSSTCHVRPSYERAPHIKGHFLLSRCLLSWPEYKLIYLSWKVTSNVRTLLACSNGVLFSQVKLHRL